jgi:glyoxylase-like metal-dependent hydrolase (beta-lactamase superfamily II)
MEAVLPDLNASAPEALPFAPSLDMRAFVLIREPGNLLIYSAGASEPDTPAIQEPGDIARRYLNHWHEALFVSDRLDAPLFCHENDREAAAEKITVHGTFSGRHRLDGDFEVIPTPGHTPGATAYLWESGEHRLLFPSDTIYLHEGEWIAAVLESSDRAAYLESLDLIRQLDFDGLVPWIATRGYPYYATTNRADAQRRIDAIIQRVRRGEDR